MRKYIFLVLSLLLVPVLAVGYFSLYVFYSLLIIIPLFLISIYDILQTNAGDASCRLSALRAGDLFGIMPFQQVTIDLPPKCLHLFHFIWTARKMMCFFR